MGFLDNESAGVPVLSRVEQDLELQFFITASAPFQDIQIKVASETITTHEYKSSVLAPTFTAITSIHVTHHVIGQADVVEKLQTQMQSGENIYESYINDSEFIGRHWRDNLTDWMAGEGADVTLSTLGIDDFIGTGFITGSDGKLCQLPDQQFANLYWFRADRLTEPKKAEDCKATDGYELGVPVNWSAYDNIAELFTSRDLSHPGVEGEVFGTMDCGKKDPSLGWRYIDARMCMVGIGEVGEPNGLPVVEWGIRANEISQPDGSRMARGGATISSAAVYAVEKAIECPEKYSPLAAASITFSEAGPLPAQGNIVQQIFWYTACTAATVASGLPVMNEELGADQWFAQRDALLPRLENEGEMPKTVASGELTRSWQQSRASFEAGVRIARPAPLSNFGHPKRTFADGVVSEQMRRTEI